MMVRAQDSVSCGEFELVSPALCDADVDGRLTVGGRAEEERRKKAVFNAES